MKVTKFGGSSLANAFQIQKVCNILLADEDRRIMVVSAPGKRTKDDTKVTDLLIAVAKARIAGESYDKEVSAVLARYEEIADELGIKEVLLLILDFFLLLTFSFYFLFNFHLFGHKL